jgi:hypothetical protein
MRRRQALATLRQESIPMNHNISRRTPVTILAAIGGLLTLVGILLATVPLHHGTIPQWNGLCSSGVGQIGQLLDSSAQQDCGAVSLADHLIGWLLGAGILALTASALLWISRRPRGSA